MNAILHIHPPLCELAVTCVDKHKTSINSWILIKKKLLCLKTRFETLGILNQGWGRFDQEKFDPPLVYIPHPLPTKKKFLILKNGTVPRSLQNSILDKNFHLTARPSLGTVHPLGPISHPVIKLSPFPLISLEWIIFDPEFDTAHSSSCKVWHPSHDLSNG